MKSTGKGMRWLCILAGLSVLLAAFPLTAAAAAVGDGAAETEADLAGHNVDNGDLDNRENPLEDTDNDENAPAEFDGKGREEEPVPPENGSAPPIHGEVHEAGGVPVMAAFEASPAASLFPVQDFSALESAVAGAASGDTILLLASSLSSDRTLTVDKDLTFTGITDVTICGTGEPIIRVAGSCTLIFENVTLSAGGILVEGGGDVSIEGAAVNAVGTGQAALDIRDARTASLHRVNLRDNAVSAISFMGDSLEVTDSHLTGNRADEGGGIFLRAVEGRVDVAGTQVTGNTAAVGGGIYCAREEDLERLYIDADCHLHGNQGSGVELTEKDTGYIDLHNSHVLLPLYSFSDNCAGSSYQYAYNGCDVGWAGMPPGSGSGTGGNASITITLDANGGQFQNSAGDGNTLVYADLVPGFTLAELLSLHSVTVHREGHRLVGWTGDWEANVYWPQDAVLRDSMILYAVWERTAVPAADIYTVDFHLNGEGAVFAGDRDPSASYPAGSLVVEPDAPLRAGHTFLGWRRPELDRNWDFDSDTVTGDITLLAHWQPDTDPDNPDDKEAVTPGPPDVRPGGKGGNNGSDRRDTDRGSLIAITEPPVPLSPLPPDGPVAIGDDSIPLSGAPNPSTGDARRTGAAVMGLSSSAIFLLIRRPKRRRASPPENRSR